MRIRFTPELFQALKNEANELGVSIPVLVIRKLNALYQLNEK